MLTMKNAKEIGLLALLLTGLPLAGIWVAGHDPALYLLEFPPRTRYAEHAAFSWPVFIGLAVVITIVMLPFLIRICATNRSAICRNNNPKRFPWWGGLSIGLGLLFWSLAWMRQTWFEPFQLYSFTPQWLCYIVAINAMTRHRTGRSLLTHNTKFLLLLFPLSAAFWWFFEYLNRFVQNWWYTCGTEFAPAQYFIAATLSFSTVLPAVLSTEEWIASNPRNTAGLKYFIPIHFPKPKLAATITLLVSASGLLFIGRYPDQLFPLLWVAPLLLLMALQTIANRPSFFPEIETGDWRRIYRFCLAALICGFFWEMWNWHSLAKWIYSVPYVDRFHLFEMPILGYAGYLPFGLECAVIAQLIRNKKK
ncbi:hypothetical protein [Pontiella sulfatireligans]|uniref:Uncharacterized protein n=1 Tax=Pontiella sulfatireligans TaxID=2750658 RepID=A0A6C2UQ39_9BACT|nr:hypothetical protein [Pontiella sulfatireligans]VGO21424.1 hypothetical protein SCARR_03497 [Pontiella sulfatireligans]